MFVGFYKFDSTGVDSGTVTCLLGRSALTKASHPVTIIKQVLTPELNGSFQIEGDRLLAMAQAQDIYTLNDVIDPDIAVFGRTMLAQILEYKIANPSHKVTLNMSIGRYKADQMFYLDWEDRWVSIQETDPNMVGKTYLLYKIKKNGIIENDYQAFETIPFTG